MIKTNCILLFISFTFPATTPLLSNWLEPWVTFRPFVSVEVRLYALNAQFYSDASLLLDVVSSDIIVSKIAGKSSVRCFGVTLFSFSECGDNYHFYLRKTAFLSWDDL